MDAGGVLFPRHIHLIDIIRRVALEEGVAGVLRPSSISGNQFDRRRDAHNTLAALLSRNGIVPLLSQLSQDRERSASKDVCLLSCTARRLEVA